MDLEQLERKTSESLPNGTKEDNFVKGEIKTDQILDQEEPAEIDSMDEADAGTHSAPKRVHTFYFVKFRPYELTKRMQCKIEQHKLETQRRRKEIIQFKKELTYIKVCFNFVDLDLSIVIFIFCWNKINVVFLPTTKERKVYPFSLFILKIVEFSFSPCSIQFVEIDPTIDVSFLI